MDALLLDYATFFPEDSPDILNDGWDVTFIALHPVIK